MDDGCGLGWFSPPEWDGWTMISGLDGTTPDTLSCTCRLIDRDGDWTREEKGIQTTDAHVAAVFRLADRARQDGHNPPDMRRLVALIREIPLEPNLDRVRAKFYVE